MSDDAHLDPSRDVPEAYQSVLGLLCDLWDQVRCFRSCCPPNEFVLALLADLESRLVAMGVVLKAKAKMDRNK